MINRSNGTENHNLSISDLIPAWMYLVASIVQFIERSGCDTTASTNSRILIDKFSSETLNLVSVSVLNWTS